MQEERSAGPAVCHAYPEQQQLAPPGLQTPKFVAAAVAAVNTGQSFRMSADNMAAPVPVRAKDTSAVVDMLVVEKTAAEQTASALAAMVQTHHREAWDYR